MIRALIVDDEPPARLKLRRWLEQEHDIEVIGESADGLNAAHAILSVAPDVVFLDIQMPGLSGLQLAAQLDPRHAPLLVFVTAYDAHALAAFDLNAVDYLLKPFDEARLKRTLERVRQRFDTVAARESVVRVARAQTGISDRLLVPAGNVLRLIDCSSIHSLQADDNYVEVHTAEQCYVVRRTLRDLLQQLGDGYFVQVHKSAAVNLAEVESLAPLFKGDYELRLRSGRALRLSRRYAAEFFRRTGR
jgi:two-component system, LytTR family, response regulator